MRNFNLHKLKLYYVIKDHKNNYISLFRFFLKVFSSLSPKKEEEHQHATKINSVDPYLL